MYERSVVLECTLSYRRPRNNKLISSDHTKLTQAHTNSSFTRVIKLFYQQVLMVQYNFLGPNLYVGFINPIPRGIALYSGCSVLSRLPLSWFSFPSAFPSRLFASWLIFFFVLLFCFPFDFSRLFLVRHILQKDRRRIFLISNAFLF